MTKANAPRIHYHYVIRSAGVPIYVGKGKGNRCGHHLNRPEFTPYDNLTIEIVRHADDAAARATEARLIAEYDAQGIVLINKQRPRIAGPLLPLRAPSHAVFTGTMQQTLFPCA